MRQAIRNQLALPVRTRALLLRKCVDLLGIAPLRRAGRRGYCAEALQLTPDQAQGAMQRHDEAKLTIVQSDDRRRQKCLGEVLRRTQTLVVAVGICFVAPPLAAAQTTTLNYGYDALGRLISAGPTGSPAVLYAYDLTDNRTSVGNDHAPVAVYDSFSRLGGANNNPVSGTMLVVSNDTDADLPSDTLTIVALDNGGFNISIASATSLSFTLTAGWYPFTYTIQDSHGARSSVTSDITITCRPSASC